MEENLNRRVLEEGSVEARTIEEAIAVLRCGWVALLGAQGASASLTVRVQRVSGSPSPVESLAGQGALPFR